MGAALLSALAALCAPQGDAAAEVRGLQREGRFAEALARATQVKDAPEAARLEAEVRWAAGDLDGALGVATEGLRAAPADLGLASLAADVALTLDLAAVAEAHLAALDRSLAASPPEAGATAWWRARREELGAGLAAARERLGARDRALTRARVVGAAAAVGAALAFGLLWRRSAADRRASGVQLWDGADAGGAGP